MRADTEKQFFGLKLDNGKYLLEKEIGSWELLPPERVIRIDIYTKSSNRFSLKRKNLPKKRFKEFVLWSTAEWSRTKGKGGKVEDKLEEKSKTVGWHDGETAYLNVVSAQDGSVKFFTRPIEQVKLHSKSPYRREKS